ncbi:hypothetical protein BKP42_44660 [Rhodococcus erythropolis]|nr:hypothetical protein BKP42_44660 [Rhodococcus erythropolis]
MDVAEIQQTSVDLFRRTQSMCIREAVPSVGPLHEILSGFSADVRPTGNCLSFQMTSFRRPSGPPINSSTPGQRRADTTGEPLIDRERSERHAPS